MADSSTNFVVRILVEAQSRVSQGMASVNREMQSAMNDLNGVMQKSNVQRNQDFRNSMKKLGEDYVMFRNMINTGDAAQSDHFRISEAISGRIRAANEELKKQESELNVIYEERKDKLDGLLKRQKELNDTIKNRDAAVESVEAVPQLTQERKREEIRKIDVEVGDAKRELRELNADVKQVQKSVNEVDGQRMTVHAQLTGDRTTELRMAEIKVLAARGAHMLIHADTDEEFNLLHEKLRLLQNEATNFGETFEKEVGGTIEKTVNKALVDLDKVQKAQVKSRFGLHDARIFPAFLNKLPSPIGDTVRNFREERGLGQAGLGDTVRSVRRSISNLDFDPNSRFGGLGESIHFAGVRLKQFTEGIDEAQSKMSRLAAASRGFFLVFIIKFAEAAVSSVTALAGALVAVASSAIQAGVALGGIFVAGIAQALPVIGLFVATLQRLQLVNQALTLSQRARQQESTKSVAASNAARQAEEQKAQALRRVRDANEAVTDATKGLIKTREDARRQLQDLTIAERQARLEQESSRLSTERSQFALRQSIQAGSVSDIAQSQLDVKSQDIDTDKARIDFGRARTDYQEAKGLGVDKAETVIQATRALRNAKEAAEDAKKALREAGDTAADTADQGVIAQRQLNFILGQMSDAEVRLFRVLRRVRNEFKEAFAPVTDIIINSIARAFRRVEKLLGDQHVLGAFKNLATEIGKAFDKVTDALLSPGNVRAWTKIIKEAAENIGPITDLILTLGQAFVNIAIAAGPALSQFIKFLGQLADQFLAVTDSNGKAQGGLESLTDFFIESEKHLESWILLAVAAINLMAALVGSAAPEGKNSVEDLTDTLNNAADNIRKNATEVRAFFHRAVEAIKPLGLLLLAIGAAFYEAFDPQSIDDFTFLITTFLLPALVTVVQLLGFITHMIRSAFEIPVIGDGLKKLTQWAVTLSIFGGALYTLVKVFTVFGRGILFARAALALLVEFMYFTVLPALEALAAALIANPVTALIVAIVALIAILVVLQLKFHIFNKLWAIMKDGAKDVIAFFRKAWDNDFVRIITLPWRTATRIIVGIYIAIFENAKDFIHKLITLFKHPSWHNLKELLLAPFKGIANVFKHIFDPIKDAFTDIIDFIVDKIGGLVTKIPDTFLPGPLKALKHNLEDLRRERDQERDAQARAGSITKRFGENAEDDVSGKTDQRILKKGKLASATKHAREEDEKHSQSLHDNAKAIKGAGDASEQATGKIDRANTKLGEGRRAGRNASRGYVTAGRSAAAAAETVTISMDIIGKSTNSILGEFGAKTLKFGIDNPGAAGRAAGGLSALLTDGFAEGGMIPGTGSFDTVPLVLGMAAPGEAILNKHQQDWVNTALANTYGFGLDRLFQVERRPHYMARGGILPPQRQFAQGGYTGPGHSGEGFTPVWNLAHRRFGMTNYTGFDGHSQFVAGTNRTSDHFAHRALDMSNGVLTKEEDALNAFWKGKMARTVKQLIWRDKDQFNGFPVGGHQDHVHLALKDAFAFNKGLTSRLINRAMKGISIDELLSDVGSEGVDVNHVKRVDIKGRRGPLRNIAQRAVNRVRREANKYIDRKAEQIQPDVGSGPSSTGQYDAGELSDLWVRAGGDPKYASIMARVALAESGGNPKINNAGREGDGGRTIAAGLWQILGLPFQGNVYNALTNAKMAVKKFEDAKAAGADPLSPWYSSKGAWGRDFSGKPHAMGGFVGGVPYIPNIDELNFYPAGGYIAPRRRNRVRRQIVHDYRRPSRAYAPPPALPPYHPTNYRAPRSPLRDTSPGLPGQHRFVPAIRQAARHNQRLRRQFQSQQVRDRGRREAERARKSEGFQWQDPVGEFADPTSLVAGAGAGRFGSLAVRGTLAGATPLARVFDRAAGAGVRGIRNARLPRLADLFGGLAPRSSFAAERGATTDIRNLFGAPQTQAEVLALRMASRTHTAPIRTPSTPTGKIRFNSLFDDAAGRFTPIDNILEYGGKTAGAATNILHELGHFADYNFWGNIDIGESVAATRSPLMDDLVQTISETPEVKTLKALWDVEGLGTRRFDSFLHPEELFARAYEQWQASIYGLNFPDLIQGPFTSWSAKNFKPIAYGLTDMFSKQGLLNIPRGTALRNVPLKGVDRVNRTSASNIFEQLGTRDATLADTLKIDELLRPIWGSAAVGGRQQGLLTRGLKGAGRLASRGIGGIKNAFLKSLSSNTKSSIAFEDIPEDFPEHLKGFLYHNDDLDALMYRLVTDLEFTKSKGLTGADVKKLGDFTKRYSKGSDFGIPDPNPRYAKSDSELFQKFRTAEINHRQFQDQVDYWLASGFIHRKEAQDLIQRGAYIRFAHGVEGPIKGRIGEGIPVGRQDPTSEQLWQNFNSNALGGRRDPRDLTNLNPPKRSQISQREEAFLRRGPYATPDLEGDREFAQFLTALGEYSPEVIRKLAYSKGAFRRPSGLEGISIPKRSQISAAEEAFLRRGPRSTQSYEHATLDEEEEIARIMEKFGIEPTQELAAKAQRLSATARRARFGIRGGPGTRKGPLENIDIPGPIDQKREAFKYGRQSLDRYGSGNSGLLTERLLRAILSLGIGSAYNQFNRGGFVKRLFSRGGEVDGEPALMTPGEAVLNDTQQGAINSILGIFGTSIPKVIKKYASGGFVGGRIPSFAGGGLLTLKEVDTQADKLTGKKVGGILNPLANLNQLINSVEAAFKLLGQVSRRHKDAFKKQYDKALPAVSLALKSVTDPGGLIDQLKDRTEKYITNLGNALKKASVHIIKATGLVGRSKNQEQVLSGELGNLSKAYNKLVGERGELNTQLKNAQRSLHAARRRHDRDAIQQSKGAVNKIQGRLKEVDGELADNLTSRQQKQTELANAIIDASRKDADRGVGDAERQLRRAQILGRPEDVAAAVDGKLNAMRGQRAALASALEKTRGLDPEVTKDLQDQIAELDVTIAEGVAGRFTQIAEAINNATQKKLNALDVRKRIAELSGPGFTANTKQQISLTQEKTGVLNTQRSQLQNALNQATAEGNVKGMEDLTDQMLQNELAILENNKELATLNGTLNAPQGFKSSSWEQFRNAIFDGLGGLLPQYQMAIPQAHTGAIVTSGGLLNVAAAEIIRTPNQDSGSTNQEINFNITQPTEVLDTTYLGQKVAWELKHI